MTFPQYVLQVSRGFTGHLGAVVGLIPPDGVPGPWFLEAVWRPRVVAFRLKGILDPRHIAIRSGGLPGEVLQTMVLISMDGSALRGGDFSRRRYRRMVVPASVQEFQPAGSRRRKREQLS